MTGEFAIAVHALVFLNRRGETVNSETLADNVCTHPARLRGVMAKLKKAGLVDTKEGMEGGYAFRKDPAQVTLRQICDALNVKLVSASWRSGSVDKPCMISSGMADVMDIARWTRWGASTFPISPSQILTGRFSAAKKMVNPLKRR